MEAKNDKNTEMNNENADAKIAKSKSTEKNITIPRFTKEQLVNSSKYRDNSDLLNAILEYGHSYTSEEIEGIIQAFHEKGGV